MFCLPTFCFFSLFLISQLFGNQSLIDITEVTNAFIHSTTKNIELNTYIQVTDTVPYFQKSIRRIHDEDNDNTNNNDSNNNVNTCYNNSNIYEKKIQHDIDFYDVIRHRFLYKNKVNTFRKIYFNDNDNDLIIGLHLLQQNQQQDNDKWMQKIIDLIRQVIIKRFNDENEWNIIPMTLFIVSDTSDMIIKIQKYVKNLRSMSSIKVISYHTDDPSILPLSTSTTTKKDNNDKLQYYYGELQQQNDQYDDIDQCLLQYEVSFIDMMLLSYVDVLIAANPSALTQTLPMQLVLATNGNQQQIQKQPDDNDDNNNRNMFCEININADNIQCYTNYIQWYCEGSTKFVSSLEPEQQHDFVHIPITELPIFQHVHELNNTLQMKPRPENCLSSLSSSCSSQGNNNFCTPICLPSHWPINEQPEVVVAA